MGKPEPRPPSLLWEEMRRAWRELRGARLSPLRGAAAAALGVFIGCQPIFGCHTPLVLAICIWLQLDAAIAWVASNISNPFFAPFLVSAEVQVGGYLWTGAPVPFDARVARETGVSGFAGYAFLGAPLVGLVLGLAAALLVCATVAVKRRFAPAGSRRPYELPPDAPAWWHTAEQVAARYAPPELSTPAQRTRFHYVRIKLLGDPVAQLIADLEGAGAGVLGEVLDVGTGRGQLPIVLMESSRATAAVGLDWDAAKIDAARRAAARHDETPALCARFEVADARQAELAPADTVLLVDVLHYLSHAEQDGLLRRAARAVRPGGRLVVREADAARGWRSTLTRLEEWIFTSLRFNRGARVCFRPARELAALMRDEGLACEIRPAWGRTPFANVLIVGRRQGRGGDAAGAAQ